MLRIKLLEVLLDLVWNWCKQWSTFCVVTLTGTQTLTNKSLTSPTITGTGAIAGTFTGDLTGDITGNADTATK